MEIDEKLEENNFILKKRVFESFVVYNIYRSLKVEIERVKFGN